VATLVPPPFDGISTPYNNVALAVCVIGMPALGRLLAVAVPDKADIGIAGHVVLRIMLPHRRAEDFRGAEILLRGQALVVEYQGEMFGQGERQLFAGRRIDGL
jgi:hypothetical protein